MKRDIASGVARRRMGAPLDELPSHQSGRVMGRVRSILNQASYEKKVATLPPEWIAAHRRFVEFYHRRFVRGEPEIGIVANTVRQNEVVPFAAFVGWTGWFRLQPRPESSHTYTHNWPPDPELGLSPSTKTFTWTA